MFSSGRSFTTEDFCRDFGTGSSGINVHSYDKISFVGVLIT